MEWEESDTILSFILFPSNFNRSRSLIFNIFLHLEFLAKLVLWALGDRKLPA
ncbi:hypothetical protein SAMN04489724_1757 [Algoriphagus locisalis]|uniref:Uncharacterized protein n=1 Tax=Algoriphagus locisalis TaxID=305507 RepID=A0A1I7A8H9_9BACT|nr:hypothetical protein SAMN04489724_1757 [Algoriphagus locisalis]